MAEVHPLRGIRYDAGSVALAAVLAPPYDVISPEQQERLYERDPHNVVRIDYGRVLAADRPGVDDRYTRARADLDAWLREGVLRRDRRPALYVHDHTFPTEDGRRPTRRGVFCRVAALPWDRADVLPHERTLRGPKEDRLALMRATGTQTSAVFAVWDRAPGAVEALGAATSRAPDVEGGHDGEVGREDHRLWVVDDPAHVDAVCEALRSASLYIADGHHRFETAAAYAAERREAEPGAPADADFTMTLLHVCDAADPAVEVMPTHRLVLPAPGVPGTLADLSRRLGETFALERHDGLAAAVAQAHRRRDTHHAFAVAAADGAGLLSAPRTAAGSPRDRLDVAVLEDRVLAPGCGVDTDRVAAGALAYTRDVAEAAAAVTRGDAVIAFCLNGCTTAEIVAVSDARQTMPQKSTYFYPKVPTGLVLSPV